MYQEYRDAEEKREAAAKRRKEMCGDVAAPLTTYEARLQNKIDNVSKEKEQQILDLLHSGLNVGKVAEEVGLESIVVAKIMSRNIKSYGHYLAKKVEE